ncbi:hypothetical protein M427DRAFT_27605 [Gonapodya prolifera JEL478]|uniref:Uncharacterized protein n=1 Tax=Gonapodya prolifera (strain JEL478) TaxID=1344416 RepID=A0A139AWS2_GONPJ|nr:hypothetical protein M427DRAFT_27605 [Gonapodya prolifera JEL478]|eukprot:KXS21170.1 hypothetical protein M427DRAFT_27605 [Gonapodya prolifera JEL478]
MPITRNASSGRSGIPLSDGKTAAQRGHGANHLGRLEDEFAAGALGAPKMAPNGVPVRKEDAREEIGIIDRNVMAAYSEEEPRRALAGPNYNGSATRIPRRIQSQNVSMPSVMYEASYTSSGLHHRSPNKVVPDVSPGIFVNPPDEFLAEGDQSDTWTMSNIHPVRPESSASSASRVTKAESDRTNLSRSTTSTFLTITPSSASRPVSETILMTLPLSPTVAPSFNVDAILKSHSHSHSATATPLSTSSLVADVHKWTNDHVQTIPTSVSQDRQREALRRAEGGFWNSLRFHTTVKPEIQGENRVPTDRDGSLDEQNL